MDNVVVAALNSGATIYALLQIGNILFLGGNFTSIGGVSRNGIAAVDATTGTLLPFFNAGGVGGGTPVVMTFHFTGSMLLVGGYFTSFGGATRNGIAAIDPNTGTLLPWYPTGGVGGPSFFLSSFAQKGNYLYLAGHFTSIGGIARTRLAAVDLSNASVLSWYPTGGAISGFPRKIVLGEDGNTLFLGGSFLNVGGVAKARLVALDSNTGSVLPFTPPLFSSSSSSTPYVDQIIQIGSKLFIAGDFNTISSQNRMNFAVVDATTGALLSDYPPNGGISGYGVYALAKKENSILLMGVFTSIAGVSRFGIANLDPANMQVLSWYPPNGLGNTDVSIQKASVFGPDTLWISGYFSNIGGLPRNGIAKLNLF